MIRLIPATLLLTVFLLPIGLFAAPVPVVPGVPFALGPGQSADVEQYLYLVFTGIESDSRCPLGAICVWEGDAIAAVMGDLPGEIQVGCDLHTSAMFSRFCQMGPYEVHLLSVIPHPVLGGPPIDPADYQATFVVTKTGPVDVQNEPWGTIKALYR